MENNSINYNTLLPFQFKLVGFICLMLIATFAALVRFGNVFDEMIQPNMLRSGLQSSILLGLFLIASSRERVEDELIGLMRLKSFEWAFRWGVLYTVVDALLPGNPIELTGFSLIFSMLIVYLLVFYSKKREISNEK